jgi:hypothetical protein
MSPGFGHEDRLLPTCALPTLPNIPTMMRGLIQTPVVSAYLRNLPGVSKSSQIVKESDSHTRAGEHSHSDCVVEPLAEDGGTG